MKNLKIVLLFCLLAAFTSQLFVQVDAQPFCFTLNQAPNNKYHFHYECLNQEPNLDVKISSSTFGMMSLHGQANQTSFDSDSTINVCIQNHGKHIEPIGIDFYLSQHQKLRKLALKSDIQDVHKQLMQAAESLNIISHNARFEEQKKAYHAQIIEQHQKTINWYAKMKIVFILLLAVGQIWIFSRYLSKNNQKLISY